MLYRIDKNPPWNVFLNIFSARFVCGFNIKILNSLSEF